MKKIVALGLIFVGMLYGQSTELEEEINACRGGDIAQCYQAGLHLTTGENAKDQEKKNLGVEFVRKACKYGETKACDLLGDIYFKEHHYQASMPYLADACNKREVKSACEAIGTIYRDGHETPQDDTLAREFYEKACALKSKDACINVALIYRGGFGVAKHRAKEKYYYQQACQAGSQAGCDSYTTMDNEDKGIEPPSLIDRLKSLFN